MKNNKVYIVLIAILILFAVLMYFMVGKEKIEKRKQAVTILTGEKTVFEYSNNKWSSNNNIKKYDWKKFSIFLDNEYKGEYYVWNDDRWLIFDDNKEAVNYTENFLGISANINVNLIPFNTLENSDLNYASQVLRGHDISPNADLTVNTVTNVDIDGDGIEESIYIISNAFPIDFEPAMTFSYIFMVKEDQIYMIYQFEDDNNLDNGLKPYISSILDVDNDGIYELLITYARYSTQEPINALYKFENNQFKNLVSG